MQAEARKIERFILATAQHHWGPDPGSDKWPYLEALYSLEALDPLTAASPAAVAAHSAINGTTSSVRRPLGQLKEGGYVDRAEGRSGGSYLTEFGHRKAAAYVHTYR